MGKRKNIDKCLGVFLEGQRFLMSDRELENGEIILTHRAIVLRDELAKFPGLQPRECQRSAVRRDSFLPSRRRAHINPEWVILFLI